jgi:hypothetical protein
MCDNQTEEKKEIIKEKTQKKGIIFGIKVGPVLYKNKNNFSLKGILQLRSKNFMI